MKILFLGDIVGRPGRAAVAEMVPKLRKRLELDLVVANGENASGGIGLTAKYAKKLLNCGIDALTTGNHIWKFRDIYPFLNDCPHITRPANYQPGTPGRGVMVLRLEGKPPVAVINLSGRTFMQPHACPFHTAEKIISELDPDIKIILIDFHAEATSEKAALYWMLNGRVTGVFGTHTHVQTSDIRISSEGTAGITDLGMCGPVDSCLGMAPKPIIENFLTGMPQRWEICKRGPSEIQGVLVEVDENSGKATGIELVKEQYIPAPVYD